MRKITFYLIAVFIMAAVGNATAQLNISVGSTVTQNFDTLGTAAIAMLPAGWKVDTSNSARTLNTYAGAVSATMRSGGDNMTSSAGNGSYNFGAGDPSTAIDRAIGGLSASTKSKSVNVYTQLINTGASRITGFSISYDIEKYRKGKNAGPTNPPGAPFMIQMYYSADGANWTSAGNDFLTSFPADDTTLGYAITPGDTQFVVNKTLPLTVDASDTIYLAWNYSVATGTYTSYSQALGIDNVSITATASTVLPPAKLTITNVNSGAPPVRNTPFQVTVQVRDSLNNPVNAPSNIDFQLFVANGTGTLSGSYAGSITAGSNQVVLSGISYNVAENGVTLTAHDMFGALTYDTCAPFNVLAAPIVAERLKILSVNGGNTPVAGNPFSMVIQAQDNTGVVTNVTTDVIVNLALITGTGSLGGTLTDTIMSGTNQVAITGILYNTPESGVSIEVADNAAALTSDTTGLLTFNSPYPDVANLPTSYDWTPSVNFPTGWYPAGLGSYTTGHIAPNSGKFDNTGDNLVIHFNDTAGTVRYFLKTNGVDSVYRFEVMESVNGIAFSPIATYSDAGDTLNTVYTQYVLSPSPDARFIKFVYSQKTIGNIAIDEVLITAHTSVSIATKIKILSVNNGTDPGKGVPFPVQIQTQDISGNPATVAADVHVSISKASGTGNFGGTLQGVILAGTFDAVIDGVTYDMAENGVSLTIIDDSSNLDADTSGLFNVTDPYPLVANIPTYYAWDASANYPDGWYNTGLTFYTTGHLAPNSGKFDTQGDNIVIHFNDSVTDLRLWLKGNTLTNPYQFDIMESVNGGSYTALKTFSGSGDSLRSTFTEYRLVPSPASRFVKLIYTTKTTGNVAIDEVLLTNAFTGISDIKGNMSVSIYPNPGYGRFYIRTDKAGDFNTKVFDLLGKQIYTGQITSPVSVIDLGGLDKGIYLVRITDENSGEQFTGKIVLR